MSGIATASKMEPVMNRGIEQLCDLHGYNDWKKSPKTMKSLQGRRRSAPGAVIFKSLSKTNIAGNTPSPSSEGWMPDSSLSPSQALSPPTRLYVLEGRVELTTGLQTQERYLFLFNDFLLVGKQKSSNAFKLKARVRVCEMWVAECIDDVAEVSKAKDRSFVLGWPVCNCVATFHTTQMRELWYNKLTHHIQEEKEREEPKYIEVLIKMKDKDITTISKRLSVHNFETADSVVTRSVECLHLVGKPREYQLWVTSPLEDAPYPLIGHERPYSIMMNAYRNTVASAQDAGAGSDEFPVIPEVKLRELLQQTYFTLRPSRKAPDGLSLEEGQTKRVRKGKKSPLKSIMRLHRWGLQGKTTESPASAQEASAKGCLFGKPLAEVCKGEELPKAIKDMLQILFQHAPFTLGVFRKSASVRAINELRVALDTGQDYVPDDTSVMVAGSVLKEFLRAIPGGLLNNDFFKQWKEAVSVEEDKVRVQLLTNLVNRLPQHNQILLRHFMCVLHHITLHSKTNNMDFYNLSVCVGQSMMEPANAKLTTIPQRGGGGVGGAHSATSHMKDVALVAQHLIQHCTEVFGEDVVGLLGEQPQGKTRQDSSTDSDSVHSMLGHTGPSVEVVRQDTESLDSLDRDIYPAYLGDSDAQSGSPITGSPKVNAYAASRNSSTTLSRDSGVMMGDNYVFEDGGLDQPEPPSPASPSSVDIALDRTQYSRSVSQLHETGSATASSPSSSEGGASLSQSYGHLDRLQVPRYVPAKPPRKSKRRDSEPPAMHNPASSGSGSSSGSRGLSRCPAFRHDSTSQLPRQPTSPLKGPMKTLGVSMESLTSVGTSVDSADLPSSCDVPASRHTMPPDMGVLRRSESGMHLYMNGELLHTPQHQPNLTDSVASDNEASDHVASEKEAKQTVCERDQVSPTNVQLDFVQPVDKESARREVILKTRNSAEQLHKLRRNKDKHLHLSCDKSAELPQTVPPDTEIITSPAVPLALPGDQTLSKSMDQSFYTHQPPHDHRLAVGSPPHKVLLRNNLDPERMRNRVFMTAKGSDVFPNSPSFRHSYHEGIDGEPGEAFQEKKTPTNRSPRPQSMIAESDYQQQSKVAEPVTKPQKQNGLAESITRPQKPPTYQEAINRKSLLKAKAPPEFSVSDEEVVKQSMKSAKARELYEKSINQYNQETVPEAAPGAMQRSTAAVTVKRHQQQEQAQVSSEQGKKNDLLRRNRPYRSNSEKHTSGDNAGANNSNNNMSSGRFQSAKVLSSGNHNYHHRDNRARIRDRRGHRNSDTKLQDKAQKNRNNVNLSRSKSDSSEHTHKIKFRELKSIDNKSNQHKKRPSRPRSEIVLPNKFTDEVHMPRAVSSVRDKDWHKDLAQKYSDLFYQPTVSRQEPQYAYVKSTKTYENESEGSKPKRGWTRPVHPSKDLIVKSGGNKQQTQKHQQQQNVARVQMTKAHTVPALATAAKYEPEETSDKENTMHRSREQAVPSPACSDEPRLSDVASASASSAEDEPPAINWSVSKLRNLYDTPKPAGTTQPFVGRRGLKKSATIPKSREESFV